MYIVLKFEYFSKPSSIPRRCVILSFRSSLNQSLLCLLLLLLCLVVVVFFVCALVVVKMSVHRSKEYKTLNIRTPKKKSQVSGALSLVLTLFLLFRTVFVFQKRNETRE